jgi:uncharacterized protein (DUF433 family)
MNLPDFLQRGALGEIRFAASRIDLYFVLAAFRSGMSPDQIAAQYPTLPLSVIRSAINFYRDNRSALDEYIRHVEAEIANNLATIPRVDGEDLRNRRSGRATDARVARE